MDHRRTQPSQQHEDGTSLIAAHLSENPDYEHLASEFVYEDSHGLRDSYGYTRVVPLQSLASSPSLTLKDPAESKEQPYKFERYLARATANTVGPLLVFSFFLFIVYEYLLRPALNGVAPHRLVRADSVFFFWVVISIFILDWAKSAIAGFEAAALMKPRLAPSSAIHLMWHLERDWGSISGWYRAAVYTVKYWISKEGRRADPHWDGPGLLWGYLALSSILFFIAVPSFGLAISTTAIVRLGNDNVIVIGPNQTTFDARTVPEIADQARNAWRQGLPTTPYWPTIFYALNTTNYISDTFYDDLILAIYQADANDEPSPNRDITFFSGPRVADQAHGNGWGLLSTVSCSAVNIYTGLELIKVETKTKWSAPGIASSTFNFAPVSDNTSSYVSNRVPTSPGLFFSDTTYGIQYEYLVAASDAALSTVSVPQAEYGNSTAQPLKGSLEIAIWQATVPGFSKDVEFESLSQLPLIETSNGSLGYGVKCSISSKTGFADLNAARRTFSNFELHAPYLPVAEQSAGRVAGQKFEAPGLLSLQWLVFAALTKVIPGFDSAPACLPANITFAEDPTCNFFYSANVATGGVPYLANFSSANAYGPVLRQAIISPARMTLAVYKIFGQTAAAMMSQGPGNWTTDNLKGVEQATDLVAGIIPWQLVLTLLLIWVIVTVVPQCWTFTEKRWSSTLEGFELFRFGAEYRDVVQRFESNEAWENKVLRKLPGMVGDLERTKARGFIGLSWWAAIPKKEYVNNRLDA